MWTGSEMIVWGGQGEGTSGLLNTGGRYNPSTNTWRATSTTSAPDGRTYYTAVWTGSEMIVWGGDGPGINGVLDTGGRYNPSTNTWRATSTTNAPIARDVHTAVWTGSEMIVWGGPIGLMVRGLPQIPAADTTQTRIAGQPPAPPTRLHDGFTQPSGPAVK